MKQFQKKKLKILMVLHMDWNRNLGAPRVQIELADELIKLGHTVEKFDLNDAFTNTKIKKNILFRKLKNILFSYKVFLFIRANGHRFDVIDGHHGNIPFHKKKLKFAGKIVCRSAGLNQFYEAFTKWENSNKKRKLLSYLNDYIRYFETILCTLSMKNADIIFLPNHDEKTYVDKILYPMGKCCYVPFGISENRAEKLHVTYKRKKKHEDILFVSVGSFIPRKGAWDWNQIILNILNLKPNSKFLFLGTGGDKNDIIKNFDIEVRSHLKIIPNYESSELPFLLKDAHIGMFPSYIEGFGIGVLEMLSAGIPVVAYDVPGPREMLNLISGDLLTPCGNINEFSNQLIKLANMESQKFNALCNKCIKTSNNFTWDKIAIEYLQNINS